MTREERDKFWVKEFGNAPSKEDFAGCRVDRYAGEDSKYGWTVDHILPQASNGPNTLDNKQIVNCQTNAEKADNTTFEINGVRYQVKKVKNLKQDDRLANYPYKKNDKKYCVVVIS
jgi:CRISPR/Cas system Type II protein with McrA/HNH and RuvC-like nuclease domain